jgi:hypothetical protein
VTLPARAAAVRGDDYQYGVAWYWACRALTDSEVESVSVEDAGGGSFDDIVIRRRNRPGSYKQVKSSNTAATTSTAEWLTTPATATGRSPLRHFYDTWTAMRARGDVRPDLALVTNRGLDSNHPILQLRDNLTETVGQRLRAKTPRSEAGRARRQWARHLAASEAELLAFLADLRIQTEGSEASWDRQAIDAMRAAGLRDDPDALARGKQLVRTWVKTGAGPQSTDDIRRQVAEAGMLARSGTLVLAIHAIDRVVHPLPPTVTLDWVDRYGGDTPRRRRQLRNPDEWASVIAPELAAAARTLESYGVRRVHLVGAFRLPTWFAAGAQLPDTRGWVLSLDQRGVEWRSDTPPSPATARVLKAVELGQGPDLAVAVGLTHDPTDDVVTFLRDAHTPARQLLVLGPAGQPGQTAVPDAGSAIGWAHAARTELRHRLAPTKTPRLHLFLAAPAGSALLLGHHWNLLPPTLVYEHLDPSYAPTLTVG